MNRIIIDSIGGETKIAITNNNKLDYYYVDRVTNGKIYGNIYLGRVEQIRSGMQGAFINIGDEKNGLLHKKDIFHDNNDLSIEEIFKQGQEVLVQVKNEQIGQKGARITTKISIPGHYIVLLPNESKIYISKKIKDKNKIKQIKDEINKFKPKNMGVIVRTEAENVEVDKLNKEIIYLIEQWEKVSGKKDITIAPTLLYKEKSYVLKIIRDYYTNEIDEIIINNNEQYNEVLNYMKLYLSEGVTKLKYEKKLNLVREYNLEDQIKKLYARKIWLKNGGNIIIDYTEAFTVIDINSGKYSSKNKNMVALHTNLEATGVIAEHIRLRNLSGIILIDYIDMKNSEEKIQVLQKLKNELSKDKVNTTVLGFSKLSIVEITRKQEGKALHQITKEYCNVCNGTGRVLNDETLFYMSLGYIESNKDLIKANSIKLCMNPSMIEKVREREYLQKQPSFIKKLEDHYKIKIVIEENRLLEVDEIRIMPF